MVLFKFSAKAVLYFIRSHPRPKGLANSKIFVVGQASNNGAQYSYHTVTIVNKKNLQKNLRRRITTFIFVAE